MSFIIIAEGEKSSKIINGHPTLIRPAVGALYPGNETTGRYPSDFGIGYRDDKGNGTVWGLMIPQALITSWRAMKLLEQTSTVGKSTLANCYEVAKGQESAIDYQRSRNALVACFDSIGRFDRAAGAAPTMVPDATTYRSMLRAVEAAGIKIDTFDITPLLKAGKLPDDPYVAALRQEGEQSYIAAQRKMTEGSPVRRLAFEAHRLAKNARGELANE